MKKTKSNIKNLIKEYIAKYDGDQYIIHVPLEYLAEFKFKYIRHNIMKQYAQHYKIIQKRQKNSRRDINCQQLVAYDFLIDKEIYDQVFNFYYELLSKTV